MHIFQIAITDIVNGAIDTRFTDYYEIVLKPKTSGTYKPAIFNSDSIFRFTVFNTSTDMLIYVGDLFEYYDSNGHMNQKDDQDRENIEEQSEQTEEQSQDASDEANQQGQTLLEAFGSLITAITNIHTTNCTIPNFSIYGLNFQNMDFCQFNVPNGLMAIASIGMVFIFVPLGINLVKRMIALYNEILGGK